MMGNLFYRKVSPAEIRKMDFQEMEYWNKWHERISKEWEKIE